MLDFLEETITRAKAGDKEAAEDLIRVFRETVLEQRDRNGKPFVKPSGAGTQIDEPLLDYLAECFGLYLDHAAGGVDRVTLDRALNLSTAGQGRTGRPAKGSTRRAHMDWGLRVRDAHRALKREVEASGSKNQALGIKGEEPLEVAILRVAEEVGQSAETVRKAYGEWRAAFRRIAPK